MTSQNPLFSYDSLRSVIGYLDPLVRLQISTHCPSLHNLTRIVPMKIKNLRITRSDFKINSTTYKIGIIRKYINRKNPKIVEEENTQGGYQFDTDSYGIRRNQRIVMPNVSEIGKAESDLEETLRLIGYFSTNRLHANRNDLRKLDRDVDTIEMKLDIYRAMLEIAGLPFTMRVQLLIIPDDGPRKIQYLVYNKTLQEVKDSWMIKLFGTNIPIHVKNMNVGEGYVLDPVDLGSIVSFERVWGPEYFLKSSYFPLETSKLKVSNLSIHPDILETLNAIRPVLDGSPLKIIKVDIYRIIPDDPIIQTSKLLNLSGYSNLGILRGFSNERIHLEMCIFTEEEVGDMIKHWHRIGIKIGTNISIGFHYNHNAKKLLNSFRGLIGARRTDWKELRSTTFPECVVLPIGDHSELHVYCETPKSQDTEYCKTEWIVRIKIQEKGFSDNLV